jgi:hypothetical protein
MRKRKVVYPPAKTATRRATPPGLVGGEPVRVRESLVTIDTSALDGRAGIKIGDRVRIGGSGLYAGEAAVVERLASSAIPSAFVRTEAGRTRQVRQVDLEPIRAETRSQAAEPDARPAKAPTTDPQPAPTA